MPITDFDRYPLTFGPSPVHPLDRLTQHLGGRSRAASLRVTSHIEEHAAELAEVEDKPGSTAHA